ncbi:DUF5906 domain-containing protein [Mesorhizobium sp. MSK_1335]|uniref:DUF5906 domain-containing protein n=1 Tax=Mesorhizobium montanum TaxID=3072323 RepID=A0ABU4ZIH9_9HYPH|nr:DUF5906 domain-containing protein [Mesorhizobium sp. MSK_1335]MDX8525140.1 DUF5906 domain-containing protein [Mesorhizobium sp. MSK_1335]
MTALANQARALVAGAIISKPANENNPSAPSAVLSIERFFETIFGPRVDRSSIHVVTFGPEPGLGQAKWFGRRWNGIPFDPGFNNYFTIAPLKPGMGRTLGAVMRHVLIVADDVGTKVDPIKLMQAMGCPPTFKIETSPGNQTWGWVLNKPVDPTDTDGVQLLAASRDYMKHHNLTDPGTADPVRLIRLYVGTNTKEAYQNPFDGSFPSCGLIEWNPTNTIDLEALGERLLGPDFWTIARSGNFLSMANVRDGSGTADFSDPLIKLWAEVGGDPRRGSGPGKVDANCPNMAAHSQRPESGFAFLGGGIVKCQHGECGHLTVKDMHGLMYAEYERQVEDRRKSGALVDDGSGHLADVFTGEPVPVTGANFIARQVFLASEQVQAEALGVPVEEVQERIAREAQELSDRDQKHDAAKAAAITALGLRFIYVASRDEFYDLLARVFLSDKQLDRHEAVVSLFPAGGTGYRRASNYLLNHGIVRRVYGIAYVPGNSSAVVDDEDEHGRRVPCVNIWVGSDVGQSHGIPRAWLRLMRFVYPNREFRRFLIRWMAFNVQHPEKRTSQIPLTIGGQGTGKDMSLGPFIQIMGRHNVETVTPERLASPFNDWMRSKIVVLSELKLTGDARAYNRLKDASSVDERLIPINEKNKRPYMIRPRINFIAMSNHADAIVGVEGDDRRWAMYHSDAARHPDPNAGPKVAGSIAFYSETAKHLTDRAEIERVHGLLARLDIRDYNPSAPAPDFAGTKASMIAETLAEPARWTYDECREGQFKDRELLTIEEVLAAGSGSDSNRVRQQITTRAVRDGMNAAGCTSIGQVRIGGRERARLWIGANVPPTRRAALVGLTPKEQGDLHRQEVVSARARQMPVWPETPAPAAETKPCDVD